jgi:hypothetical protein
LECGKLYTGQYPVTVSYSHHQWKLGTATHSVNRKQGKPTGDSAKHNLANQIYKKTSSKMKIDSMLEDYIFL